MPQNNHRVPKRCRATEVMCTRCFILSIFSYPSLIRISPVTSTCDRVQKDGCFKTSRKRQFVTSVFGMTLLAVVIYFIVAFPLDCRNVSRTTCLQSLIQLLFSITGIVVILYAHLNTQRGIEVLTEWYKLINDINNISGVSPDQEAHNITKRSLIYTATIVSLPLVTGGLSYLVFRNQDYPMLRMTATTFSQFLQTTAIFRHVIIMAFLEFVHRHFGKAVKQLLQEEQEHPLKHNNLEEKLKTLRKYYSSVASSTLLFTQNKASAFILWLCCIVLILGINVYNLVFALSDGFSSETDVAVPAQTFGSMGLIVYLVTCVQRLSDAVSHTVLL